MICRVRSGSESPGSSNATFQEGCGLPLGNYCLNDYLTMKSYHLAGIMLEYETSGELKTKCIDLLNLSPSTDVNALVEEIQKAEPVITASRSDQVKLLLRRLQDKLRQHSNHQFYLFKVLRAHILPLTNVALNKSGSCFITGSYDRTCKLWDTASGEELHTLEGHRNVVYAIAFNNPYGDKIATGSFDKTCKLWSVDTGKCYHTFRGHTAEIVCLSFNPQSTLVATGSMDTTAKLWDIQNGEEALTLTERQGFSVQPQGNALPDWKATKVKFQRFLSTPKGIVF
ncbi:wd repeat-containing protein 69 [Lynx pardinus]|uniref:Wd repeat-containing protein 69 n=1 Tax=Lynx pardinus TaxID=191816 RepID=A0A485NH13_LYNPA|nr:wd repeat-containing protein 69 [Lynx pardinus]